MGAADAYMLGHSRIGDAARRAGLFAAGGIPFMLQNVGGDITRAMTCHMMAAFPTASFHFFSDCETWAEDVVHERSQPVNGFLRVPEKPGLGVTLDREALERLKRLELPAQPKWIIRSRFANGARMYNIADPAESIFMVRPDRRRLIPMGYGRPHRDRLLGRRRLAGVPGHVRANRARGDGAGELRSCRPGLQSPAACRPASGSPAARKPPSSSTRSITGVEIAPVFTCSGWPRLWSSSRTRGSTVSLISIAPASSKV